MSPSLIDRLNVAADSVYGVGANHFLQIALLAVVLAAIDVTIGRRIGAYWRCALWLLFFAKLALPPQLALPSSPAYWLFRDVTAAPVMSTSDEGMARTEDMAGWADADANVAFGARVSPPSSGSATPAAARDLPARYSWRLWVVAGWMMGVCAMGSATLIRRRRLWRDLRLSHEAPQRLQSALARAQEEVRLARPVRLRLTETDVGPLVAGLRCPTIFLPHALAAELPDKQMHCVLVHELLHIRRGDLWVAAVQAVARVLFFHHPAVWWVNAHLARLREEATDRAVLSHASIDARAYSLALVAAAEVGVRNRRFSPFALGVTETKTQLEKRIKMNLHQPRPRRWQLGSAGLFSLAVLAVMLVPMAPAGSADTSRRAPAGFEPIDPAAAVHEIDATVDRIFASFNRRDRDGYVAAFTPDALIVPPASALQAGHVGVAEGYMRAPAGLLYSGLNWRDRQVHHVGSWWIETGTVALRYRLSANAAEMVDHRTALTVWEEGPGRVLKVKVLSWNPASAGAEPGVSGVTAYASVAPVGAFTRSGDFTAVLDAEERMHRAFEQRNSAEAASYYADHAVLIPPGTAPLRGLAEIRRHIEGVPPDHSAQRIERTTAHVEGNDNCVLVVNLFRWTFKPADGTGPVSITGKGVHFWQRQADGSWRVLFDLPNSSQRGPE